MTEGRGRRGLSRSLLSLRRGQTTRTRAPRRPCPSGREPRPPRPACPLAALAVSSQTSWLLPAAQRPAGAERRPPTRRPARPRAALEPGGEASPRDVWEAPKPSRSTEPEPRTASVVSSHAPAARHGTGPPTSLRHWKTRDVPGRAGARREDPAPGPSAEGQRGGGALGRKRTAAPPARWVWTVWRGRRWPSGAVDRTRWRRVTARPSRPGPARRQCLPRLALPTALPSPSPRGTHVPGWPLCLERRARGTEDEQAPLFNSGPFCNRATFCKLRTEGARLNQLPSHCVLPSGPVVAMAGEPQQMGPLGTRVPGSAAFCSPHHPTAPLHHPSK